MSGSLKVVAVLLALTTLSVLVSRSEAATCAEITTCFSGLNNGDSDISKACGPMRTMAACMESSVADCRSSGLIPESSLVTVQQSMDHIRSEINQHCSETGPTPDKAEVDTTGGRRRCPTQESTFQKRIGRCYDGMTAWNADTDNDVKCGEIKAVRRCMYRWLGRCSHRPWITSNQEVIGLGLQSLRRSTRKFCGNE